MLRRADLSCPEVVDLLTDRVEGALDAITLAGLKKQIAAEVAKVVDSLEREAKIAALTEDAKTKTLNQMKSTKVEKGPDEAKLRNLEATAKSKRAELAPDVVQKANRAYATTGGQQTRT